MSSRLTYYLIGSLFFICALFLGYSISRQSQLTPKIEARKQENYSSSKATQVKKAAATKSNRTLTHGIPMIEYVDGDIVLKDCPLNELILRLAKDAELLFQPILEIEADEFLVSGTIARRNLKNQESIRRLISDLCFQYDLTDYVKGNTLELLTKEQVTNYPAEKLTFKLGNAVFQDWPEQKLANFIKPYLTPHNGEFHFDSRTGVVTIRDTPFRNKRAEKALRFVIPDSIEIDS